MEHNHIPLCAAWRVFVSG